MYTCIVCIGSNYDKEINLRLARRRLTELFSSVRFADEEYTKPLHLFNPALFFNQLVRFSTEKEASVVILQLKTIEKEAGRKPEDKMEEKVKLDIDLLMYDGTVLKQEDMNRKYVIDGLRQLLGKDILI
ncbi:2-amino-4-hydroxy-6-hydroxymethyldihydropteridine diphosphokinase [uncultured Bacteroides sp.]|uniref:2-amino-4-hydroxy-6- hydroxymethyldihydropteridine diphosphokinase n=1 Tax=uncultured Bacteroides sp. TaxID=162156 RepID=UPI002AA6DBB6|nr:2-amino-4-hydroxy-6-hydroxymethyldihydropteridine diphosphokinase [uncultured Bacteroides sp.]